MGILVVINLILLLTDIGVSSGVECPPPFFNCGEGKCISEFWVCDGDNDCGNFKDEQDCENNIVSSSCPSSQFECKADRHCIPNAWHCDGEKDCEDGSDEKQCENVHECKGFHCHNHQCIPTRWRCDGRKDCDDGSDEELCPLSKLCKDFEYHCSSGSCIKRNLLCDGKPDCTDGSDEGLHCSDSCEKKDCSQKCERTPSGVLCSCKDGYALDWRDKKTCFDIDECSKDGICSHICVNTLGSYKCSCLDGYELINGTCKAKGAAPVLIFSTSYEIRGMRLGLLGQYFSVRKAIYKASTVDVDPNNQRFYWVEISNISTIYSANLDGSGLAMVLSHGLLHPEDIAVDYIANNLYLTDSGLRQVLVCTISGTMCHVLHEKKVEKPHSIALDLDKGFLYWSDWEEHVAGIYRSGMDGSKRISLVFDKVEWPNGLSIDHTTNRLYWADFKLKCIEYITLDGRFRKVILSSEVFHPYSMAVFEDKIYWADWSTFSLESCDKFTGRKMSILARENGKHIKGVHVYHPVLTAKVTNPCWSNDCSHMCLISPTENFSCACPHGFELSSNGKSCTIKENEASIFVNEGSSVFYIRPEAVGNEAVTELPLSLNTALITRVSYDAKSRSLFVADVNAPAIHVINMTSLHIRELVKRHIISPEDLSFDWMSDNLYWIDSSKGTAELIATKSLKRILLLKDLGKPVALGILPTRGYMFIATTNAQASISMYDMDGKNMRILHAVQGHPMSLALHPSRSILFWADPRAGTISFINYLISSPAQVLIDKVDGVMSVASSENYIYWTTRERELSFLKGNVTFVLQLPGQEKGSVTRKVIHTVRLTAGGKSACHLSNGGCSYLCLTSPHGRTCACPSDMVMAADNKTCVARRCEPDDFRCMSNGRCLPVELRCDGSRDCDDGSDEVGCGTRCSGDDFRCKNGRCVLKSWRCDFRDDCTDNSDEEDCPESTACATDHISCTNGQCISMLWRCDGEPDCEDSSDETNCNETKCDPENQHRCDNGQCVPISWVCDGTSDCYDESDEKNCSEKSKLCLQHQFTCESDGKCVDEELKCDGRGDCEDGSDEKNCSTLHTSCKNGMYRCEDGHCIYHDQVCDGNKDCSSNEDEINCNQTMCQHEEVRCLSSKRCIFRKWICDGSPDCADGSDERNCGEFTTPALECEEFFCHTTGQCLSWSKVCDGKQDCEGLPDEGGLCSRSCSSDNGGCSQMCRKTPHGPKCSCFNGYRLRPDNRTCDDIDECLDPRTCNHFCNNTKGGFKCNCADGYFLHRDHRVCKADGGPASIVYLLRDQIRGFDLASKTPRVYVKLSDADMRGMDHDLSEGVFYWTDWNYGSINSYSPDTHRQDILVRLSPKPLYVRCDWIEKNLYYTDEESNIGVCTNEGKFCRNLTQFKPHIDGIDISPTTGEMFWTVWAIQPHQISGLIVRAEMDGSNVVEIITEKTIRPTAITVDHVLKMIYWTDVHLNTIECADFQGLKRRQMVQYNMKYPHAMAVFEDNVYWSDWGSDGIIKCKKFSTEEDCLRITQRDSKADVLMIVHKVMQPRGTKQCLNRNCPNLCLPTRSSPVCKCKAKFIERNGICIPEIPSDPVECPKHYCLDDAKCVIEEGKRVCKCSPPYTGNKCQGIMPSTHKPYDYSWIIFVLFIILVLGVIILIALLCFDKREEFLNLKEILIFKFRNRKADHLVIDTSEDGACDELFPRHVPKYRQSLKKACYTLVSSEDYDIKKRQPSRCEAQTINTSIVNFFKKQKLSRIFLQTRAKRSYRCTY